MNPAPTGGELGDLPLEASFSYHFECNECAYHTCYWWKEHRELNPEYDLKKCHADPADGSAPD